MRAVCGARHGRQARHGCSSSIQEAANGFQHPTCSRTSPVDSYWCRR
jgi:hypothetical protein